MAQQSDHTRLIEVLSTAVLANVAALTPHRILHGQRAATRLSRRKRFPSFDFYGNETMVRGLPGHRHAWPEIATVLTGRFHFGIERYVYEAASGDWLVLRPNVVHGECCLQSHATYSLLWLVLRPDLTSLHVTRYTHRRGYEVTTSTVLGRMPTEWRADIRWLADRPWTPLIDARRRLLAVAHRTVDLLAQQRPPTRTSQHPLIDEVQSIIDQSTAKPPSLAELAGRVGLSPNYLSNLFHDQTNVTLRQYIDQHRVALAKQKLTDPSLSIKQVAYALGFADPYHFSHVFRRVTGTTPTNYRQHAAGTRRI